MQHCSTSSDDGSDPLKDVLSAAVDGSTELLRLSGSSSKPPSLPYTGPQDPDNLCLLYSQGEQGEESLTSHSSACSDSRFDAICKHYYPLLHRVILNQLGGESRYAEDIVQETLIAASNHWHKLRTLEEKALRCWLRKTAINKCRDYYRHEKRRPRLWSSYQQVLAPEPQVRELEFTEDNSEQIWRTLKKLSSRERECVILILYYGYSIEEVADMFKIKRSSVRSHLTRGRQKFALIYQTFDI